DNQGRGSSFSPRSNDFSRFRPERLKSLLLVAHASCLCLSLMNKLRGVFYLRMQGCVSLMNKLRGVFYQKARATTRDCPY
ncbi:MAG: hypothetical protein ACPGWR_34075, partial [Ardenticatenaceae bacterium]